MFRRLDAKKEISDQEFIDNEMYEDEWLDLKTEDNDWLAEEMRIRMYDKMDKNNAEAQKKIDDLSGQQRTS